MAALITLITGVAFSLFLITSDHPKKGNGLVTILSVDGKTDIDARLKFKNLASLSYPETQQEENQNNRNLKTDNLTERLTNAYVQEFLRTNQGELQNVNGRPGLKPPPDASLENILQENLNRGIAFKIFELKDVRISNDNFKENQLAYIGYLDAAGKKNFGGFHETIDQMLNAWINKKNAEPLNKYLNISSRQINDLLAIETPSLWQEFHLQNINLWQKKFEIYTAILNQDGDPLKAALAIKQVPNLIQENQDMQSVLGEKIKELDLK